MLTGKYAELLNKYLMGEENPKPILTGHELMYDNAGYQYNRFEKRASIVITDYAKERMGVCYGCPHLIMYTGNIEETKFTLISKCYYDMSPLAGRMSCAGRHLPARPSLVG